MSDHSEHLLHESSDSSNYPAKLNIDYPEKLNRFTTFFRLFYLIPIIFLLSLISGAGLNIDYANKDSNVSQSIDFEAILSMDSDANPNMKKNSYFSLIVGPGALFLAPLFLILFRKKYPKWWFDWNLALTRFQMRVTSYMCLLRDEYPSSDQEQAVHVNLDYPDASKLNRWLPLVKWFLAIPHIFILAILGVASIFSVIIAWFAILITGKYPKALFNFVVGVLRWGLRVNAYALLLITDKYPPFSLNP